MCTGTYALAFDVLLHACVARVVCVAPGGERAVRPRTPQRREPRRGRGEPRGQAGGGTESPTGVLWCYRAQGAALRYEIIF